MKKLLGNVVLITLLFCSSSFGASQLKKTICPSGCDYTSLEACLDDNEQDLTSTDYYFDIEISGDWTGSPDTTVASINNYTSDATRYINIYTVGDARHDGTYSAKAYKLESPTNNNSIEITSSGYLIIDGLCLRVTPGALTRQAIVISSAVTGTIVIKNNIFKGNPNNDYSTTRGISNVGGTNHNHILYIYNNIFYDFYHKPSGGASAATIFSSYMHSSSVIYQYNNTAYGGEYGLTDGSGGTKVAKNNLCYGHSDTDMGLSGTTASNASSDTSSPNDAYDEVTVTFADTASDDYHLVSGDTDVIGEGEDLSGTFTTDIDGETRSAWDIGADEYVSAAVTAIYGATISGATIN